MAHSRICSIEGCGKREQARGWCAMHYARWYLHGAPGGAQSLQTPHGETLRFLREVVLPYDGSNCLIWPFSRDGKGYAKMAISGGFQQVHRLVCEHVSGPPPTPQHHAAHSCGRGHDACVAPNHIRWATPVENEGDKRIHGTINRGERNGSAKLTEVDVLQIRRLKGQMSQQKIAKMFAVGQMTVCYIHRGKTWAWLDGS